jgi:hypothetical protein
MNTQRVWLDLRKNRESLAINMLTLWIIKMINDLHTCIKEGDNYLIVKSLNGNDFCDAKTVRCFTGRGAEIRAKAWAKNKGINLMDEDDPQLG